MQQQRRVTVFPKVCVPLSCRCLPHCFPFSLRHSIIIQHFIAMSNLGSGIGQRTAAKERPIEPCSRRTIFVASSHVSLTSLAMGPRKNSANESVTGPPLTRSRTCANPVLWQACDSTVGCVMHPKMLCRKTPLLSLWSRWSWLCSGCGRGCPPFCCFCCCCCPCCFFAVCSNVLFVLLV